MPQLPLQLMNYEQQVLFSENEKQGINVSRVSVSKVASARAHPLINDS